MELFCLLRRRTPQYLPTLNNSQNFGTSAPTQNSSSSVSSEPADNFNDSPEVVNEKSKECDPDNKSDKVNGKKYESIQGPQVKG